MRSKIFNRTVAAVTAMCVLALVACNKHDDLDVAAPEAQPVADVVDEGDGTLSYAYLPGNPYHEGRMARLMDRPDVAATIEAFSARGLRLSRSESITLRGIRKEGSVFVTFVALDGGERSGIIACYGSGDRFGISPVEFSLNEPSDPSGWRPFVGSGWYSVPEIDGAPRSPQRWEPFEWWDWGFFGRCLLQRAPEASALCAVQCIMVPGYWHCFMMCTAAEALGATISCILDMYQWGGNEIKKD